MLTTKQIESQVKNYPLAFSKVKDEAEHRRLPSMLDVFNKLVALGRIPTQDQFVNEYFAQNPTFTTLGVEARLRRTFPSFVRELHGVALLRENFELLADDTVRDQNDGVDAVILYKGQTFHIHLFIDTWRSNNFRQMKNNRHEFSGHHLDMKLNPSGAKTVGNFFLYSEPQITSLKAEMEAIINGLAAR